MEPQDIIIGKTYRNSFVEKAVGEIVIYKGVKRGKNKKLLIIQGVGKGSYVREGNFGDYFWRSFYEAAETKNVINMESLLTATSKFFQAQHTYANDLRNIIASKTTNPVVRATAKKLLEVHAEQCPTI